MRLRTKPTRDTTANFNPRTPGGVRRCARNQSITFPFISIHAPRVGCDVICYCINKERQTFQSTHPGWGATYRRNHCLSGHIRFQSTHPGWGATYYCAFPYNISFNFNPRTPGGVRPCGQAVPQKHVSDFNPRTPGGVRHPGIPLGVSVYAFQSTHPGWGATTRFPAS